MVCQLHDCMLRAAVTQIAMQTCQRPTIVMERFKGQSLSDAVCVGPAHHLWV